MTSGTAPPTAVSEAEYNDLVRQGERTVDNLKRIFAVAFTLSFGLMGLAVIAKLKTILTSQNAQLPGFSTWAVNIEMVVMFVVTAGVFYHQSAKFLDIRYAKRPLSIARPFGFAFDYMMLVLTVAPFYLMASAFHPDFTHQVGYLWFFFSYILLLCQGLFLLVVAHWRHAPHLIDQTIPVEEVGREKTLRTYWFLMNSFIVLVLLASFYFARRFLSLPCPPAPRAGGPPFFLFWFGAVALTRDYLDYRWAWRFLYPLPAAETATLDKWPIKQMIQSGKTRPWTIVASAFCVASIVIIYLLKLWDVQQWVTNCSM